MTYIEQRITELTQAIERLSAQRSEICSEVTLLSGRSADDLRENYYREENRRSGLRAIDQSIDGAEAELERFRKMRATGFEQ